MDKQASIAPHSKCMSEWALFYASTGFPIIPLYEADINGKCSCKNDLCHSIGKHPRVKNGLKDASFDPDIIQKWWSMWPDANIGLITGQVSRRIVVDVDPKNGGLSSLESLESQYGPIGGLQVTTGGNGIHFYYELPDGLLVKNKVNLLPGIDIRSEAGYIVAPPSLHKSGNRYSWTHSFSTCPPVPSWLIALCLETKKLKDKSCPPAIESLSIQRPQAHSIFVSQGSRNSFLCSMAGSMQKYGLNQSATLNLLKEINHVACFPALDTHEVEKIAQSIANYSKLDLIQSSWEDMIPMQELPVNAPLMPLCLIPFKLKTWVVDIAKRMQIPFELVCVPALVALSSVIGKKIRIYPKQFDNWVVHPNLWGAIVARPGTLKSPTIAEALKPLEALVKKEHLLFTEKTNQWGIQKTIKTATIEAIKEQLTRCMSQNKKEESELLKRQLAQLQEEVLKLTPICKRYKTNDATVEKLVEILMENPNGLLLVRDELSGWLSTLNKAGREGEREFWLECWGGKGSYTVDRIGRGTTHASSLCLSIFGAIQPDKLGSLVTDPLQSNDDGLLQRFQLIVCPEIKEKWENHDVIPDQEAQKNVEKLFDDIANFEPNTVEGFIGLRFSHEAQIKFNEWREALENSLRQKNYDYAPYEAHLSKYRSLIPSLALLFEILDFGCDAKEVTAASLELALEWADYLIAHAKKVYQIDEYQSDRLSIQSFLKKLYDRKIYDGMTVRSLSRVSWEHLKTKDQVENTLEFFVQNNWIKVLEHKTVGRPSRVIKLNPSLLSNLS